MSETKSRLSNRDRKAWALEFDRRVAAGPKVYRQAKMRPHGLQVADDYGNRYWRNGNGCCGCGMMDSTVNPKTEIDFLRGPVWPGRQDYRR